MPTQRSTRSKTEKTTPKEKLVHLNVVPPASPPSKIVEKKKKKKKAAALPKKKSAPPPISISTTPPDEEEEANEIICSVCMEPPPPLELTKLNNCPHLFCFDCIDSWAKEENTCPLCKERFTTLTRVNKKSTGGSKKRGRGSLSPAPVKIKKASLADQYGGGGIPAHVLMQMLMSNGRSGSSDGPPGLADLFHILGPPPPEIMSRLMGGMSPGLMMGMPGMGGMGDHEDDDDDDEDDDSDYDSIGDEGASPPSSLLRLMSQGPPPGFMEFFMRGGGGGGPSPASRSIRSHATNDSDPTAGTEDNALVLSDSDDDKDKDKDKDNAPSTTSTKSQPLEIGFSDDEEQQSPSPKKRRKQSAKKKAPTKKPAAAAAAAAKKKKG
ncbi:hypothetical protein ScalyP_jg5323 [Parmales sp. scaly parma]|nr:hypothetical protein ScalyP_jg5323 [Parmales sp. scaly parma]